MPETQKGCRCEKCDRGEHLSPLSKLDHWAGRHLWGCGYPYEAPPLWVRLYYGLRYREWSL